jgi:hypothetical protein
MGLPMAKRVIGAGYQVVTTYDRCPKRARYLSTSPIRDQKTIDFVAAQVSNPFFPPLPGTSLASGTVSRSQLLQPFQQCTSITADTNQGYTWQHAMRVRFEKRLARSFSACVLWTSRTMASSSDFGQVTSEWARPRLIQFGLKILF